MHPYSKLPERAYWRQSVSGKTTSGILGLWNEHASVSKGDSFATYGSCFAQHIARALQRRDMDWTNAEPAPFGLPEDEHNRFGYGLFSARTGNIYTTSMLAQWMEWSLHGQSKFEDDHWLREDRVIDVFRPTVEPGGFESLEEMRASRQATIDALRQSIQSSDIFVFTMGLTERWLHKRLNFEYPLCPGTQAGEFDPNLHQFENMTFADVWSGLQKALTYMFEMNPKIRVILTVSPVPLVATQSGDHVLVASSYSKSVLRAVAGEVSQLDPRVSYFPSYEIITSPVFKGQFFEDDMRNVTDQGVNFVMNHFFADSLSDQSSVGSGLNLSVETEVICEEEILDAWSSTE